MYIINSIAPIFLLIFLGKMLRKSEFASDDFFQGLNRFVYWVALPAFLVQKLSSAEANPSAAASVCLLIASGLLLTHALAWILSRLLKLERKQAGSFIQGSFRCNNAFIGLPVMIYALGAKDPAAEPIAILTFGPVVIILNLLAVFTLIHHGNEHKNNLHALKTVASKTLRNPLILAAILGLILKQCEWPLPEFINRTCTALGSASLPLALISIGSSISLTKARGAASPSLIAALMKVAVSPAIAFLIAPLFGLDYTGTMIGVITLACPTAISSFVMADVMNNDTVIAGRVIAISTLLSAITLPIIIALGELL